MMRDLLAWEYMKHNGNYLIIVQERMTYAGVSLVGSGQAMAQWPEAPQL